MKEYKYTINGNDYTVEIDSVGKETAKVIVNGVRYTVDIAQPKEEAIEPVLAHERHERKVTEKKREVEQAQKRKIVSSPLPGVILSITVGVGDYVKRGQKVAVLEAMKMENDIEADRDGKVSAVYVKKDDSILQGAPIISID